METGDPSIQKIDPQDSIFRLVDSSNSHNFNGLRP